MKTSADKQEMITCFVQMVGESTDRAQQFLQSSNWQLEEAIQLFNAHNHGQGRARGTLFSSFACPLDRRSLPSSSMAQNIQNDTSCDCACPPLSGKRKSMCDPDSLIPNMDNGSMGRSYKRKRDASEVPAVESTREAKRHLLSFLPEEPQEDKGLNICRDGRKISVGYCALFQARNTPPFIGIIHCLTSDEEGHVKPSVNWHYRPADVKVGKGVLLEAAPNKVFYSFHKDEISAASLLHPCKVAFLRKGVEIPSGNLHLCVGEFMTLRTGVYGG